MSLTSAIQNLKDEREEAGIVQEEGLENELFRFFLNSCACGEYRLANC